MPGTEDLFGRSIERRVKRHRVVDPKTGEEIVSSARMETSTGFDGAVEEIHEINLSMQDCGHVLKLGDTPTRCEGCSEREGRAVYVCQKCSVQCPVTGELLCVRCTVIAPDGRRYSLDGAKQAERAGWFDKPRSQPSQPVCSPSRKSLLDDLMEWW